MQSAVASLAGNNFSKSNKVNANQSGNANSTKFKQALNEAVNKTGTEQSSKNQSTSQETQSDLPQKSTTEDVNKILEELNLTEFSEDLTVVDLQNMNELMKDLQMLMDNIPLQQGFLSEEMLQNPLVQQLLDQLPKELSQEIQAIFKSSGSVENLVNSIEKVNSPAHLLSTLIALTNIEEKNGFKMNAHLRNPKAVLEALSKQLEKALEIPLKDEKVDFKALLENIKTSLKTPSQTGINDKVDISQRSKLFSLQLLNKNIVEVSSRSQEDQTGINTKLFQEQSPLSKVQQFVIHVNQGEGKQEGNQQVARQFQQLIKQNFTQLGTNGNSQFMVKLNPEHLGNLTVKLMQIDGKMIANIIASSTSAKEILESNLQQLRQGLISQNINIEKFEIQLSEEQQFDGLNKNKEEEKDRSDSNGNKEEEDQHLDENKSFIESLEEEILNYTV